MRGSKPTMKARLLGIAVAVLVAGALLVACPRPTDGTPQIVVSANAAARLCLLASRAGRECKAKDAGVGAAAAVPARARPMAAGEAIGGPNATGKPGDWLIENGEVVFVVDALGGGGGFAESGGNLIDAADAIARKDELGQVFTYFGTFPRQGVYTSIRPRAEEDGTAVLEARGHELYEPSLEVVTEYRLGPGDRALLLRTTLVNHGTKAVTLTALGDAIQWGGVEKIAPGKPMGFKGRSSGPYVGGIGRAASYAITSTEGEIAAISGGGWTDTEQTKEVAIAPGAQTIYERVFVVGARPDVASLVSELTRAAGGDVGRIAITLVDASAARRPMRAPTGAKVVLTTPDGAEVMSIVAVGGRFDGEVPPGTWGVAFAPSAGRRGVDPTRATLVVKKDETAEVTLAVSDAAKLDAGCLEQARALPCKITIEGVGPTPTPDLGPGNAAGPAKNQLIAATEPVALAPGTYRLTSSRGPEYLAEAVEATLEAGATRVVRTALRRVVDTAGYVATDFHQHTILSADAPVGVRDRVLGNVAEAVEVAVASEHNVVADLGPVVRELGFGRYHVSIPGDELTTDASREPWGHANVFPLAPRPDTARGGALVVRDRPAADVFAAVRALGADAGAGSEPILQVNHPRSGSNGYFDLLDFDRATGKGRKPGYSADFDALEVWNGRNVTARAKVLEDFAALLRAGQPVTAIADTDTHGVVGQEAGLPRTYVRVAKDDALEAWDDARTADLVRGVRDARDVVLTNGPFLRVTANGVGIGGVARAAGGRVEVKLRVSSAPFVVVDRAELRLVGGGKVVGAASVPLTPRRRDGSAMEAEVSFVVAVTADDAFYVTASGTRPMRPMFAGEDGELAPWAMTGAIWIDADGDGKALGRTAPRR